MRRVFFLIMFVSIAHGMFGVNGSGQDKKELTTETIEAIEVIKRIYVDALENLDKNFNEKLLRINNEIDEIKQTKGYKDGDIAPFERQRKDLESNYNNRRKIVSRDSANFLIVIIAKEKEIEPEFTNKIFDALLFLSDPAYQVLSTEDKLSYGTLLSELIAHLEEKILEKGSTNPSVTLKEMDVALELETKFEKLKSLQRRAQKTYSELSYVELFKGFISGWWYGAK